MYESMTEVTEGDTRSLDYSLWDLYLQVPASMSSVGPLWQNSYGGQFVRRADFGQVILLGRFTELRFLLRL